MGSTFDLLGSGFKSWSGGMVTWLTFFAIFLISFLCLFKVGPKMLLQTSTRLLPSTFLSLLTIRQ